MAQSLLQNIDGTAAFQPVDRGAMVQVVEGEGPRREVVNDVSRDVDAVPDPAAALSAVHGDPEIPDRLGCGVRAAAGCESGHVDRSGAGRRFLYLQRLAFGGKVAGGSFGVHTNGPSRFDVAKLGPLRSTTAWLVS
jgi:hypothetical protein